MNDIVPAPRIAARIFAVRGRSVMLSTDLAALYGVEVRALVQAVKRNLARFPRDFMFELTDRERADLKSQFVISSWGGPRRGTPYAFTQEGVAMLSSVLRSPRAVRVNIEIMRAFVRTREALATPGELARRIGDLEAKALAHDYSLDRVFRVLHALTPRPRPAKRRIGFLDAVPSLARTSRHPAPSLHRQGDPR